MRLQAAVIVVRKCAAAFVMLLIASCSTHNPTPSVPTPAPPTPFPASTPTSTPVPTPTVYAYTRCTAHNLRLALGDLVSEPTEQESVLLTLTNTGSAPCFMFGYPGISLLDADGRALAFEFARSGDQVVTSKPPQRVALPVNGTAYVMINKTNCMTRAGSGAAASIRLIPPDDVGALTVLRPSNRGLGYCGPGDEGSTVHISPVEPSEDTTFQRG